MAKDYLKAVPKKGPEFHELYPFEKAAIDMHKQAEEVEKND